jgi:hypothetical protein
LQLETTDVAEKFPERVAEMYKKLEAYETTAFNPHRGPTDPAVRKTASFLEFSLCLSRACLGKMMHFIYKWRKNAVSQACAKALGEYGGFWGWWIE